MPATTLPIRAIVGNERDVDGLLEPGQRFSSC